MPGDVIKESYLTEKGLRNAESIRHFSHFSAEGKQAKTAVLEGVSH